MKWLIQQFIVSVAQKNYVPTLPAEEKASSCFEIKNNMEECQGWKVEKIQTSLKQKEWKRTAMAKKSLSTFASASSEFTGELC